MNDKTIKKKKEKRDGKKVQRFFYVSIFIVQ